MPESNALEVTVSELSGKLKRTVEDTFGHVRVRGEISGFRGPHSSGHCYFSLKDERARLEAVIWRGQAAKLKHMPEEGLEVIASGKLTTYPGSSKYQIVIDNLEPAGAGALMALLEERRKKLGAEGLFDDSRKQLLPFMPKVIGVITSPTGAVIRDILHRIKDRFPVHMIVWPVRVQGETSGREVANGIFQLNNLPEDGTTPRPDIIIVARGGGSLEDLWGFNDEALVRAAAASMIPVISAVGHETDWTLIDHAADWRAPTPTAAAEKAVPVKAELESYLADLGARLRGSMSRLNERRSTNLQSAGRGLKSPDMLLAIPRRQFDEFAGRLGRSLLLRAQRARASFNESAGKLSPSVLGHVVTQSRERLLNTGKSHTRSVQTLLQSRKDHYSNLSRQVRLAPIENRLRQLSLYFERSAPLLNPRITARLAEAKNHIERNERLLKTLSYESVLDRGYAIIRDDREQAMTQLSGVKSGTQLSIQMRDGKISTVAAGGLNPVKPENPPSKAAMKSTTKDQGSLF